MTVEHISFSEWQERFPHGHESLYVEARKANIPIPFYVLEGRIDAAGGAHLEVRLQFVKRPTPDEYSDACRDLRAALRGTSSGIVVGDTLGLVAFYDPREWRGRFPPKD